MFGIFRNNEAETLKRFKRDKEKQIAKIKTANDVQINAEMNVYGKVLTKRERAEVEAWKAQKRKERAKRISKVKGAVKKYSSNQPFSLSYDLSAFDATKKRKRQKSILEI